MKIVYLHQYFNNLDMSGGTRSYEMARRLAGFGHEVHVVTSDRRKNLANSGNDWVISKEQGFYVHWLQVPYENSFSFGARLRAFFRFAFRSAGKAASLKPDVFFATSTPLTIALPAIFAKTVCKAPLVFEVRDLWPEMPIATGDLQNSALIWAARRLEQWAYTNSTRIVALSPGMKDGVEAVVGDQTPVAMIPNSADCELFGKGAKAKDECLLEFLDRLDQAPLVYCGTLGRLNNVSYLVDIAAEMLRLGSKCPIVIVGDGAERQQIIAKAAELGVLDKNLYVLQPIPKIEVPYLLSRAAACFCLFRDIKEMWKNSANKFFDCLAAGRPVIINYGGWHETLISEESIGLRLQPADAAGAASLLQRFLSAPENLLEAGQNARALAQREFDRDQLAAKLEHELVSAVEDFRVKNGRR